MPKAKPPSRKTSMIALPLPSPEAARLRLWSLRFRDREEETKFLGFDPSGEMAPSRALLVGLALFMFFDTVAHTWPQHGLTSVYGVAESTLTGFVILLLGATFTERFLRWRRPLTIASLVFIELGAAKLVSTAPATFARELFAVAILFMIANSLLAYSWLAKLVINSLTLASAWLMCERSSLFTEIELASIGNLYGLTFFLAAAADYTLELGRRRRYLAESGLSLERLRFQDLLFNALPEAIARRLLNSPPGARLVDHADAAVVLFADIVGFTPYVASHDLEQVVTTLDMLFARFDAVMSQHGLEKIKTIGDAYMAVAGLPEARLDAASAAAEAALDMLAVVERLKILGALTLDIRIGLHLGPVMAGVIGQKRFLYDLWGDTVNVAARLESLCLPGRILVSEDVARAVGEGYETLRRGSVELKGRGDMTVFYLKGRRLKTESLPLAG